MSVQTSIKAVKGLLIDSDHFQNLDLADEIINKERDKKDHVDWRDALEAAGFEVVYFGPYDQQWGCVIMYQNMINKDGEYYGGNFDALKELSDEPTGHDDPFGGELNAWLDKLYETVPAIKELVPKFGRYVICEES